MSDFKAKMHQNRFRLGLCPQTLLGELTALPRPSSWNKGDLLLSEAKGRSAGNGKVRKWKGKRREGREDRGREGEREGRQGGKEGERGDSSYQS